MSCVNKQKDDMLFFNVIQISKKTIILEYAFINYIYTYVYTHMDVCARMCVRVCLLCKKSDVFPQDTTSTLFPVRNTSMIQSWVNCFPDFTKFSVLLFIFLQFSCVLWAWPLCYQQICNFLFAVFVLLHVFHKLGPIMHLLAFLARTISNPTLFRTTRSPFFPELDKLYVVCCSNNISIDLLGEKMPWCQNYLGLL